ncbi:MAG: NDP-sugar synthase [Candidatus Bathyarchaeota archaeon]
MKAVVLVGGFGTRLRPLSCTRPKQLFPIANKPLLDWTFEGLSKGGVDEVILATNYMANVLRRVFGNARGNLKITYSQERKPLGTGGPIKLLEKVLKNEENFLVLNGDILSDTSYLKLVRNHKRFMKKFGGITTITLHEVSEPSRFGVVKIDKFNRISRFIEKPRKEKGSVRLINAGTYVMTPEIFTCLMEEKCSIERSVFPRLADQKKMCGFIHEGLWTDIGKVEDFIAANFKIMKVIAKNKPLIGKNAEIHSTAKIIPPAIIGDGTKIGSRAKVGPYASVGNEVDIGSGCRVENSILFNSSWIKPSASVIGAVIGEEAIVGQWVKLKKGCILGDHVTVSDNVTLREVTVCPYKEIEKSILKPTQVM